MVFGPLVKAETRWLSNRRRARDVALSNTPTTPLGSRATAISAVFFCGSSIARIVLADNLPTAD